MNLKIETGITMISLVVTIILLLIISSIMITTFSGKSGIVNKATDSKIMTELSQLKDNIDVYKTKGEVKRIKNGDYSGEISNEELIGDIIIEFKVEFNGTQKRMGMVKLYDNDVKNKLETNIQFGQNAKEYADLNIENTYNLLNTFNDVFMLDINNNILYYINEGKEWHK